MFTFRSNLSLMLAAAGALVVLTASVPASSEQRAANLDTAQWQPAQTGAALSVKDSHDRFAANAKVTLPQEPEQTKMITK
jgi:hypothetical protein